MPPKHCTTSVKGQLKEKRLQVLKLQANGSTRGQPLLMSADSATRLKRRHLVSRHVGGKAIQVWMPGSRKGEEKIQKKKKIILHDKIFSLIYDFCFANYIIPKVAMILISIYQVTKFTIFSPISVTVLCRSDGAHLCSLTSAQLLNPSHN